MSWRPNTVLEALAAGETIPLATDQHGRYICPNCRAHRHAAVIIDVRALPISQDFACDCCWTAWLRELRDIDGKGSVANKRAWALRWVTAHKAPTEIVAKFILPQSNPAATE